MGITKRGGYLALLSAVPVVACAFFASASPAFLAVNVALALLYALDFLSAAREGELSARRELNESLELARRRVPLSVTNHSGRAVRVRVADSAPREFGHCPTFRARLAPSGSATFDYEIAPPSRGPYAFGDIWLESEGRLGLCTRRIRIGAAQDVRVIANLSGVREGLRLARSSVLEQGDSRRRSLGQGTDFSSIREYVRDDEYRHINWKATAKRLKLHTNLYEVEKSQTVWLVVDAGRRMTVHAQGFERLEHAVSGALGVAAAALRMGDQVGLIVVDDAIRCAVPPGKGGRQLSKLLNALSGVSASRRETDFEQVARYLGAHMRRRSLVCAFSSLPGRSEMKVSTQGLTQLTHKHVLLFIAFEHQAALARTARAAGDAQQVFALAAGHIRLRQQADSALLMRRGGVEVVRAPSGELALAATRAYLRAKARL